VKTDNLKNLTTKLQDRVSKLPKTIQGVFFEDLAEAAENRLRVLEKAWLEKRD
jgi:hypothetical protein